MLRIIFGEFRLCRIELVELVEISESLLFNKPKWLVTELYLVGAPGETQSVPVERILHLR